MRWTRSLTILLIAAAALAGCAGKQPKTALREGPRMVDLYRGAATPAEVDVEPSRTTETARAAGRRCRWWLLPWPCETPEPAAAETPAEAPSYARAAADELKFLFPRLPNPDIYIYVLPHLATDAAVPVPGYTTAVPLYERVEYALPGELAGPEHETAGNGDAPADVEPGAARRDDSEDAP